MNVYKTELNSSAYHTIDMTDYEARTARRPPWYKTSDSGTPQYFAICPACNNPIQIIGFYKKSSNTPHPYGKHFSRPIPGVGIYDRDAYEWCPYSKKNTGDQTERPKKEKGYIAEQILTLLIRHFDKVAYFIGKDTGITVSERIAGNMLRQFRDEEGWLYARATLMNAPWAFLYMTDNQDVMYTKVLDPSIAKIFCERYPSYLTMDKWGKLVKHPDCKEYIHVGMYQTKHTRHVQDNELTESMECVFTFKRGYESPQEVLRKTITFDYRYFANIINFSNWEINTRNQKLRALAKEILGPLLR
ncbi:hypothetical protein [Serratia rubidaea]|uniref:hypothetical protein n=1 Tax=Serratia rubidaea TaxID=61652 RepID=UPI00242B50C3|nr:hypothetical protein [Serratia rubidaea]MCR1000621.1 hypothetical protein [Serratia rubidaea]